MITGYCNSRLHKDSLQKPYIYDEKYNKAYKSNIFIDHKLYTLEFAISTQYWKVSNYPIFAYYLDVKGHPDR